MMVGTSDSVAMLLLLCRKTSDNATRCCVILSRSHLELRFEIDSHVFFLLWCDELSHLHQLHRVSIIVKNISRSHLCREFLKFAGQFRSDSRVTADDMM